MTEITLVQFTGGIIIAMITVIGSIVTAVITSNKGTRKDVNSRLDTVQIDITALKSGYVSNATCEQRMNYMQSNCNIAGVRHREKCEADRQTLHDNAADLNNRISRYCRADSAPRVDPASIPGGR